MWDPPQRVRRTCWGNNPDGNTDAPDGEFTAVSPGYWYTCGLRTDGTITCWGLKEVWVSSPPRLLTNVSWLLTLVTGMPAL